MPDPQSLWTPVDESATASGWTPVDESAVKPQRSWLDAASDYLGEALSSVNPKNVYNSIEQTFWHPIDTASSILQAQGALKTKAEDAFKRGDYSEGVRHVIDYLLPIIGPRLDQAADFATKGEFAKSLGATTDVGLQLAGPEIAGRAMRALPNPSMTPANPAVAEAVAFGKSNGVAVDAATATDNAAIRAAQHISDRGLGGAQIAGRAGQAQAEGLATLGEQLAAKANARSTATGSVPGQSVTPELAGQGIRSALENRIGDFGKTADTEYDKLRAIEAQQPIEVNLQPVKTAIEPIYRTYAIGADIAPLQGAKAAAVRAMARILQAPDVAMASEVDSALSDLKALQRSSAGTPGAAAANAAVDQVHKALETAVAKAGPYAVEALQKGRAATKAKYAVQDVYDAIKEEPVRAFNAAISPADTAIQQLRDVATYAPKELPNIGRAYLDKLMSTATSDGGFSHADKLFADWQKMGPKTKRMLFQDPNYIKNLDNFFMLAKQMSKNANPSGTAHAVAMLAQGSQLWNPLHFAASVAGSAGLSKFLHSDTGVRLLTEGLRMPPSTPARAAWMSRARNFVKAGLAGVSATQPQLIAQPQ